MKIRKEMKEFKSFKNSICFEKYQKLSMALFSLIYRLAETKLMIVVHFSLINAVKVSFSLGYRRVNPFATQTQERETNNTHSFTPKCLFIIWPLCVCSCQTLYIIIYNEVL